MQGKGTRPFVEIELERETYGLTRQEIISVHLLVLSRIARGVRNEMEGVVSTGDRRAAVRHNRERRTGASVLNLTKLTDVPRSLTHARAVGP